MKRHKKIWTGLLSLILATSLSAQQTGKIKQGFNVNKFPEVSFIYHSDNPEGLKKSSFWYLKEGGEKRVFRVKQISAETDKAPQTTLILWEDMAHNGYGQFDFTQKVLSGFFRHADIPRTDKFAVSVFNRRKNTSSALLHLTDGFTKDKPAIMSAIQNYGHSTEHYPQFPNRSDMYTAIREGLELMAPLRGPKAIVVFTAGYSMKSSGSDSEAQVLLKAQQLHIPVYIFQYYYRSGVAPESEGFARSTFGTFNSYMDAATAEAALTELYPQLCKRYRGHDYRVSFTSDAQCGDEARMIAFSVGGAEVREQLLPPPHTLKSWLSAHLMWVVVVAVLLLVLLAGFVVFAWKTRRNAAANRRELADLERRRVQDKKAAEQYRSDMESKARQEREEQERCAERERLCRLMEVKNLYPRLKCGVGADTFTFEVNEPITRVGREQDNDLVLSNKMVSRHHAELVFNGTDFEVIDKQSTNKVIVNGQFVQRAALKNGDVIGLGEAVLVFYV